ncbi:hypothetical protein ABEB36_001234 [Hypothenemus hampei]|uniref:tRNA-splicing endonuclease subunit Sen15 domain-containing protein n=1 Tax=Hypothenemus hampei TaxID=57062 RepID=A0ABD1FDV8_HYPHA
METYIVSEFQKLGADETTAILASQVYFELCEVKRYYSPSYSYDPTIRRIIIRAKRKPSENIQVFVPVSSFEQLSFEKLHEIASNYNTSVYLAIVHPDSTCIYYKVSNNLDEPAEISVKHTRVDKQQEFDTNIKKHRRAIEQAALLGVPITISKKNPS